MCKNYSVYQKHKKLYRPKGVVKRYKTAAISFSPLQNFSHFIIAHIQKNRNDWARSVWFMDSFDIKNKTWKYIPGVPVSDEVSRNDNY